MISIDSDKELFKCIRWLADTFFSKTVLELRTKLAAQRLCRRKVQRWQEKSSNENIFPLKLKIDLTIVPKIQNRFRIDSNISPSINVDSKNYSILIDFNRLNQNRFRALSDDKNISFRTWFYFSYCSFRLKLSVFVIKCK